MSETPTVAAHPPSTATETDGSRTAEDPRLHRRRLAAVWVAAGSAVAAMVAAGWYIVVRTGGRPLDSDMIGHAAAAEWLRTLPWWDWRGWSDWFYGGQAIGVNYPPLGHAWMRFTHPVHGQMLAVALGLLVFLPWGTLRLARAVGFVPRAQVAALGAVLALTAIAGDMHWVLSGFHFTRTFFGSWPAMVATVLGLFCAAWAARGQRPVACGIVAGLAVLFNATVVPGVAVVCVALLVTSGLSFRQGVRWAATATATAIAVCAWWLVPFLAGWDRLVRWNVPLSTAWNLGGVWAAAVLALLGVGVVWAARSGSTPLRRLALAATAGVLATLLGEFFGYLRPERWLEPAILVAAVAAAGLAGREPPRDEPRPVRPAFAVLGVAFTIVLVVLTGRVEFLPLAAWLLWWPGRTWATCGALAWAGVLLWVSLWDPLSHVLPEPTVTPMEAAAASGEPGSEGTVDLDPLYNTPAGDLAICTWGDPWRTTAETDGRIRPLFGVYVETSHAAEFVEAEVGVRSGNFAGYGARRPHWFETWTEAGRPSLESATMAETLGARWYITCDPESGIMSHDLRGVTATGVRPIPIAGADAWHSAAVEWWVSVGSEGSSRLFAPAEGGVPADSPLLADGIWRVPMLSPGESASHPVQQAAAGVSLVASGDELTVRAESPGWVWLRVPWDPDWRSLDDTPIRKGGPGHLLVWADQGTTDLRWSIPGSVDAAAIATTGTAALAVAILGQVNRRRGWEADPDRRRPAAEALGVFADTVDAWVHTATRWLRQLVLRIGRRALQ